MSSRLLSRPRSLPRALAALVVTTGLVLTVSACEVKPGAAAFVGDDKITEATVAGYVSATSTASPSTSATQLTPRAQVVSTLVTVQLFRQYLAGRGGVPNETELVASRDAAFTLVTGQATPDLTQFRTNLEGLGFAGSFVDEYVTQVELEYAVIERSKAASLTELAKAVGAVTTTPKISPRYGSWDAAQLSLAGSSTTPGYLTLSGGTGA